MSVVDKKEVLHRINVCDPKYNNNNNHKNNLKAYVLSLIYITRTLDAAIVSKKDYIVCI